MSAIAGIVKVGLGQIGKSVGAGAVGGSKGSGTIGAGGGGLLSSMGNLKKLVPIAAGMAILVQSSKALQGVLKTIGKLILLLFKPIGDIFAVALMPLIFIIKPIAQFFNMIMRPFIKKATLAMRAGGELLQTGDVTGAFNAFALGAQILLQPLFEVIVLGVTEALSGLSLIMAQIPIIGYAFEGLEKSIRAGGQNIITTAREILDTKLGEVLGEAEIVTEKSFSDMIVNLANSGIEMENVMKGFTSVVVSEFDTLTGFVQEGGEWKFISIIKTRFKDLELLAEELFGKIRKDIDNIPLQGVSYLNTSLYNPSVQESANTSNIKIT